MSAKFAAAPPPILPREGGGVALAVGAGVELTSAYCRLPTAEPGPQGIRAVLDDNPVIGERKRGPKRFWTTREVAALREAYPAGGAAACLVVLPGRTAKAIAEKARDEGLVAPAAVRAPKLTRWTSSPQIDEAIRRGYATATSRGDVRALANRLGRPTWWVSKQAARLGIVVPRFRGLPWAVAEDEILRAAPHLKPQTLRLRLARAGFARSETAIVVRLKRLGESRCDPEAMTASDLSRLMGVNPTTVLRWIEAGWLKAKRHAGWRQPGQPRPDSERAEYRIRAADVRRFVIDNAAVVDLRKVDRFWFIDMLGGGG